MSNEVRFPPGVLGAWIELTAPDRRVWHRRVRDHYFAIGHRSLATKPAGCVIRLDCATIHDEAGFWCCLGEAVQGPGGYFGLDVFSLNDCLVGGFGLTTPCVLRLTDERRLSAVLDGEALARWARTTLESFEDDDTRECLVEKARQGLAGARSFWDELKVQFVSNRVEVIDESAISH